MDRTIILVGTEEVSRAGYVMRDAAAQMQTAANTISESLTRHETFLRDWLLELRDVVSAATRQRGK